MQPYKISILIPIYNEEKILTPQIKKLLQQLKKLNQKNYEVILIDNGSTDKTALLAKNIAKKNKRVVVLNIKTPLYGEAVKKGMFKAKYDVLVQFDIDFFDFKFLKKGLFSLDDYPIIVGSKLHPQSKDKRPFFRVFITTFLSLLIKIIFGYRGTDTHGIKIYKKETILPIIKETVCNNHLFDTELLLIAEKIGIPIKELPVSLKELRKSRFPNLVRVMRFIKELFILINFWFFKEKKTQFNIEIDDYGYKQQADKKISKLCQNKEFKVSFLANFLSKKKGDQKILKRTKVCAHINLVEGESMVSKKKFAPLPLFLIRVFLGLEKKEEIRKEIEAQINYFEKNQIKIFELNSHQHIHAISPVSEIFTELSKKHKIALIRSYKNIVTQTFIAKIKYNILYLTALLSYFYFYKKIGLPSSWHIDSQPTIIMSWEGENFSYNWVKKRFFVVNFITHPYLGFDKNNVYLKFINKIDKHTITK